MTRRETIKNDNIGNINNHESNERIGRSASTLIKIEIKIQLTRNLNSMYLCG